MINSTPIEINRRLMKSEIQGFFKAILQTIPRKISYKQSKKNVHAHKKTQPTKTHQNKTGHLLTNKKENKLLNASHEGEPKRCWRNR